MKEKRLIHIEYNMKLNMSSINLKLLELWNTLPSNERLKIEIFDSVPKEYIPEYSRVLSDIENSMPDEPGNPEVTVHESEISNEDEVISILLFYNSKLIGISRVFTNTDCISVYQGQIGILGDYHNLGFGKLLLAKTYHYLYKSFEHLKEVTVDTHPDNVKMIYLLEQLGFQYTHTDYIYE